MGGLSPSAKKCINGLVIGSCAAALVLTGWSAGIFDHWEAKTWDWRVQRRAEPGVATADIVLILLDQNSLDWASDKQGIQWPWPRELYAGIIDFCRRSKVKALAIDVLFTEPSVFGVDDDAQLAKALRNFNRCAVAMALGRESGSAVTWPHGFDRATVSIAGFDDWQAATQADVVLYPRASMPIPEVRDSAPFLCNVQQSPDADTVYRRVNLFSLFDGRVLPSLGLGGYLAAHPQTELSVRPGRFNVGDRNVPIDGQGRAILRFRGPAGTYTAYSAAAVLQSETALRAGAQPVIDPRELAGKYVFFGFSAPGLHDLRPAPLSGAFPGVEISATALDNLLSGDFIRPAESWRVVLVVLVLCLLCGVLTCWFSNVFAMVAVAAVFLMLPDYAAHRCYINGLWLPLVATEAALVLTLAVSLVLKYTTEGRKKRYYRKAFRHYLSPAVIEQLVRDPNLLKLGGERRELSIFFSDLKGFTSISEKLSPEDLTGLLNDYLSAMTEIILEEGGTVDKYEGDAIIAFWNAPLQTDDHAERAVRAALRCQKRLWELRSHFRQQAGIDLYMRVGINTGHAVVGNMGSRSRFDYTIIGDAVNLASRLEGVNKQFGTYTIISEHTRQQLANEVAVRELARVAVVGRAEPVTIYEPIRTREYDRKKEVYEIFEQGLACFYEGSFTKARTLFAKTADSDPAARAYEKKCSALMQAAPEHWDGVWVMEEK